MYASFLKQCKGHIILLVQVDFAMDVFKNLYPDQDVPEGLLILLLFYVATCIMAVLECGKLKPSLGENAVEKIIYSVECQSCDLLYNSSVNNTLYISQKCNINTINNFLFPELVQKRSEVVTQLKYLQAQTDPIVKCFEDPEVNNQIQTTR